MSKERLIKKEAALSTVEFAYKACDGDIENFKELLIQCFEDLPELKAIPVEWLKEWAKTNDEFFEGELYAYLISTILLDWNRRSEK